MTPKRDEATLKGALEVTPFSVSLETTLLTRTTEMYLYTLVNLLLGVKCFLYDEV